VKVEFPDSWTARIDSLIADGGTSRDPGENQHFLGDSIGSLDVPRSTSIGNSSLEAAFVTTSQGRAAGFLATAREASRSSGVILRTSYRASGPRTSPAPSPSDRGI
jgi:hypothetical protein